MTQIRTFTSNEDKELWTLSVGNITLPFYCTPGEISGETEKVWAVIPATFTGSMFQAVRPVLDSLTFMRGEAIRYIKDSIIKDHFRKCPGVTPDFYVARGEFRKRDSVFEQTEINAPPEECDLPLGPDDFVKWLERETGMYSAQDWRVILTVLFQQIPRYMITFNRPFDFGWAILTTMPIRANAMAIMLAKFPRIYKWLKSTADRHKLEISPFFEEARRADLLDCRNYKHKTLVSWNLFISPTKIWHDYIRAIEETAHVKLGARAYLGRVGDLLHRNWRNFLEVLRAYAESSTAACGDVASPEHPPSAHLVVYKPDGKVARVPFPDVPTDFVVDPCDHGLYPAVPKGRRKREAAYVQEVPNVPLWKTERSDDGDVRGSG